MAFCLPIVTTCDTCDTWCLLTAWLPRYPGTAWWQGVDAFEPESDDSRDSAASKKPSKTSQLWQGAGYQPDSFVYINGHRYRLASIPTSGAQILVDVTKAPAGQAVKVGDSVCLLCAQHPVGDLGKVRHLGWQ